MQFAYWDWTRCNAGALGTGGKCILLVCRIYQLLIGRFLPQAVRNPLIFNDFLNPITCKACTACILCHGIVNCLHCCTYCVQFARRYVHFPILKYKKFLHAWYNNKTTVMLSFRFIWYSNHSYVSMSILSISGSAWEWKILTVVRWIEHHSTVQYGCTCQHSWMSQENW